MSNDIAPAIVSAEDHELIERMAERMSSGTALHTARVRAELTSIYAAGYAAGIGYYFGEVTAEIAEAAADVPDELAPADDPVTEAVAALRCFGDLDRDQARLLLSMYYRRGDLTVDEGERVLAAFPAAVTDPEPTPANGTSRSDIAGAGE